MRLSLILLLVCLVVSCFKNGNIADPVGESNCDSIPVITDAPVNQGIKGKNTNYPDPSKLGNQPLTNEELTIIFVTNIIFQHYLELWSTIKDNDPKNLIKKEKISKNYISLFPHYPILSKEIFDSLCSRYNNQCLMIKFKMEDFSDTEYDSLFYSALPKISPIRKFPDLKKFDPNPPYWSSPKAIEEVIKTVRTKGLIRK